MPIQAADNTYQLSITGTRNYKHWRHIFVGSAMRLDNVALVTPYTVWFKFKIQAMFLRTQQHTQLREFKRYVDNSLCTSHY